MAWIVERERDLLVRWRDAETRKVKSTSIRWGNRHRKGTVGYAEFRGPYTRKEARNLAERLVLEKAQKERRSTHALQRILEKNPQLRIEPLFTTGWSEPHSSSRTTLGESSSETQNFVPRRARRT